MSPEPCVLGCGQPGLKRRVQLLPWRFECIYVCRACMPRMKEAIQKAREQLLP